MIIDTKFIEQDYDLARAKYQMEVSIYDHEQVDAYFNRDSDFSDNTLANAAGEIYLHELAEFISTTLFPGDGSWVNFADTNPQKENIEQEEEVKKTLKKRLKDSNFYLKAHELIIQGLLYNTGFISVDYDRGLSYNVHHPDKLWMSEETVETAKRAYADRELTPYELIAQYDGLPEMVLRAAADNDGSTFKVVYGIVPNKAPWVLTSSVNKRYLFCRITMLSTGSEYIHITAKKGDNIGYVTFPFLKYRGHSKLSLAARALPDAVMVNKYEQAFQERAEIANYPPMAVPIGLQIRGELNLRATGLNALENNERMPQPIATQLDLNITDKTIARKELRLRKIFKAHLIEMAQQAGLSQWEFNQHRHNALKAIQPIASDLTSRVITGLLHRTHSLLLANDREYKKIAKGFDKDFHFDHLSKEMDRTMKLASVGRLAQAVVPYIQTNPQAAIALDSERLIREAAKWSGLPEATKSEGEVEQEKAAMLQEMEAQQQQENMQNTPPEQQGGLPPGGGGLPEGGI